MLTSFTVSVLLLTAAYLLGSFPTGYLAGRYLQGIDIREQGSGSTGATNVLRTLGKKAAIAVLLIDLLKGSLALTLVNACYAFTNSELIPLNWQPWLIVFAALAAILGHSKSIWLNFTGGKSVATTLGILLVMNPIMAIVALTVFSLFLALWRIVSLSSIAGAISVNIFMFVTLQPLPYLLFAITAGAYIIIRHRSNIARILNGTEPRIGKKLEQEEAS